MASKDQKEKLGMIIRGMKRLDKIKSDYVKEHYPGNNYTKKELDSYEFWDKEYRFVNSWTDDFPKDHKKVVSPIKKQVDKKVEYDDLDLM